VGGCKGGGGQADASTSLTLLRRFLIRMNEYKKNAPTTGIKIISHCNFECTGFGRLVSVSVSFSVLFILLKYTQKKK
jgi:hypothetical protein